MSFLSLVGVNKSYLGKSALNHISLALKKGHIMGLIGPNGAGKTTLLRIIARILMPDSGTLSYLHATGTPLLGYLPEERGLYKKMEAGEQLVYLARLKGLDKKTAILNAKQLFERYELADYWNKKTETLSKGMQQKLQFMTAIIHKPGLLILDEPFSGLDPMNAEVIKNEIFRLRNEGTTILLSTHRMESIDLFCDDITMIHQGNLLYTGSLTELKQQHASNLYFVKGEGTLPGSIAIASYKRNPMDGATGNFEAEIYLDELSPHEMLSKIMSCSVKVICYQPVVPGMEDVFNRLIRLNT